MPGNEVELGVVTREDGGQAFDAATRRAEQLGTRIGRIREIAQGVLARDLIREIGTRAQQFLGQAAQAASGLQEAVGGTEAVFGNAARTIDDFGRRSATAVGLSEREFREATTLIGGQLKRMTGDVDLAAASSIQLVEVGADLAATYGGTTKQAVDAFAAALRGEADPAERFNLNLKVSAVNAKAVELGLAASTSEVDDNAKAQALLALVMEQSTDAQGQFARESDNAAVAAQKSSAAWEDAQAKLGGVLLPIMAQASGVAATLADGFGSLPGPVQTGAAAIAAVGAALLILLPRVAAAKVALAEMGINARISGTRMRGMAGNAAKAAGVIGSLLLILQAVGAAIGSDLNPQMESLTKGLAEFGRTGQLSGEAARVLDDDLSNLQESLKTLGTGGLQGGFGRFVATVLDPAIQNLEGSLSRSKETITAVDEALAGLVEQDRAGEAAAAYERIAEMADRAGVSQDKLTDLFPAYQAALETTADKAHEAGAATTSMLSPLERLAEQLGVTAEEGETAAQALVRTWQESSTKFIDQIAAINDASAGLREDQKLTKKMLLEQLREQVEAQQSWHDNMIELSKKVPPAIFDELARLGPEGAELVQLLTTMSDEELAEYVKMMRRRGRTAGGELISEVQANFLDGAPALRAIAEQQGEKVANQIARGMRKNGSTVEEEARRIGLRIDRGVGGDRTIRITPVITPPIGLGNLPRGGLNVAFAHGGITGGLGAGAGPQGQAAQAGGPRGGADVLVGEQGAERLELPFGTRVIPAGQTRAMLRDQFYSRGEFTDREWQALMSGGVEAYVALKRRQFANDPRYDDAFFATERARAENTLRRLEPQVARFLQDLVDESGLGVGDPRQPTAEPMGVVVQVFLDGREFRGEVKRAVRIERRTDPAFRAELASGRP